MRASAELRRCVGFTLLEAVVALAIIGVVAIGTFVTYGAQLRAEARAQSAFALEALAEERLATLALAEPIALRHLPDSSRRGRFAAPFAQFEWSAEAREAPREKDLWDLAVTVRSRAGEFLTLRTRRWRPAAHVAEATR